MKFLLLSACLVLLPMAASAEDTVVAGTTSNPIEVSGSSECVSNGIAPVPSFSLGKEACIVFVTVEKGPWSYDFDYATAFDQRGWFLDNWLRYTVNHEGRTTFRIGIDFSTFFSPLSVAVDGSEEEENINEAQRYNSFELATTHDFSERLSGEVMYWYSLGGEDARTVDGHFLNMSVTYSTERYEVTPSLFWVGFTDARGFFAAVLGRVRLVGPVWAKAQLIQGIDVPLGPPPGLEKSFGIAIDF